MQQPIPAPTWKLAGYPSEEAWRIAIANKSGYVNQDPYNQTRTPAPMANTGPNTTIAPTQPNLGTMNSNASFDKMIGNIISGMKDISTPKSAGNTTINIQRARSPMETLAEANTVTRQTFAPVLENFVRQYGNIGAMNTAGRQDILVQAQRQQNDLEELYKRLGLSSAMNKAEMGILSDQAIQALGQSVNQSQQGIGTAGLGLMSMIGNSAEGMNVGQAALPSISNIGRDMQYAQALLQNTGINNQTALRNSQMTNMSIADILNAGQQAQGAQLAQQSRVAADTALRELDMKNMERLIAQETEHAKTQGEQVSSAYDLHRAILESEREYELDTAQGLFDQRTRNAELGQNWAQIQQNAYNTAVSLLGSTLGSSGSDGGSGGSGGSQTAQTVPYQIATNYIQQIPFNDPDVKNAVQAVIDDLNNPAPLAEKTIKTPFGDFPQGVRLNGPADDKNRKYLYKMRAWSNLINNPSGPLVSSTSDPLWKHVSAAIDMLFGEAKGVSYG